MDPYTIGNSKAAILLGEDLNAIPASMRRRVMRNLNRFNRNLRVLATLPKSQRELSMWSYYKDNRSKAMFNFADMFSKYDISFSLYESATKAAVRKALDKGVEFEKSIMVLADQLKQGRAVTLSAGDQTCEIKIAEPHSW